LEEENQVDLRNIKYHLERPKGAEELVSSFFLCGLKAYFCVHCVQLRKNENSKYPEDSIREIIAFIEGGFEMSLAGFIRWILQINADRQENRV
jgi:hypothetical protein